MIAILYLMVFVIVLALAALFYWQFQEGRRENAEKKWLKAVEQRIYQLTPNNKPLFIFNVLQKTWAFSTYDGLVSRDTEKIKIVTDGGEKILVNRTFSISPIGGQDTVFDLFISLIIGFKPFDYPQHADGLTVLKWELANLAQKRMFRICEDLYVQLGTKAPPGTTREEIERLNTRCYEPSEVWEALKADIEESIASRPHAG